VDLSVEKTEEEINIFVVFKEEGSTAGCQKEMGGRRRYIHPPSYIHIL
jgi:hypothetical protein